jgi:hypothetical protein
VPSRSTLADICSSARIEWPLARSPKIDERVRRPSAASACGSTLVRLAQWGHARRKGACTGRLVRASHASVQFPLCRSGSSSYLGVSERPGLALRSQPRCFTMTATAWARLAMTTSTSRRSTRYRRARELARASRRRDSAARDSHHRPRPPAAPPAPEVDDVLVDDHLPAKANPEPAPLERLPQPPLRQRRAEPHFAGVDFDLHSALIGLMRHEPPSAPGKHPGAALGRAGSVTLAEHHPSSGTINTTWRIADAASGARHRARCLPPRPPSQRGATLSPPSARTRHDARQ